MTERRQANKRLIPQPPVQATDRREAQRTPVQIKVRIATINSFQHIGDGAVLDLSESGCKICSALVLPMGSFWDLYLTIPETSDPVLILKVRVVWAVENEYGIEFLLITARERTRLRHFIWKRMDRSALRDAPPLFTLVDHSSSRRPRLKSLP
jgi:hypothetical protein